MLPSVDVVPVCTGARQRAKPLIRYDVMPRRVEPVKVVPVVGYGGYLAALRASTTETLRLDNVGAPFTQ